jgi:predicted nucleotidyltransferase
VDNALLTARVAKVPGLVAAYLFGSHARGEAKPASDVDVALWMTDAPATLDDLQLDLAADLERDLRVAVDVVILNGAPSDLIHRVLCDGVLLVERDRSARVRLEVRARSDYFDLLPLRNAYRAARQRAPS